MALSINSIISDRYHLVRLIAIGGMGQVWEAVDQRLDRKVAIKVLKAEYSSNEEFIHRFRVEAKTTAALNNSGIAQVFDYGETPDESVGAGTLAYLVMELVYGEPLSAIINRKKTLSVDYTLDILEQTATALYAAHAVGLVHRDVKPGNILITDSGEVKITDFGIAKAADATPLTQTGVVMGTAQYISPEQALGQDAASASDIYSLAVVGYEALCGKRPFTGDSPLSVAMQHINDAPPPLPNNIPLGVRNLLQHALEKSPEKRYRNGLEFAKAIRRVKVGSELLDPQKSDSPHHTPHSAKKPLLTESVGRALPIHTGTLESAMRANAALESEFKPDEKQAFITATTDARSKLMIISIFIALLLISAMLYALFVHHAKTSPHTPSHPTTENVHIFPSHNNPTTSSPPPVKSSMPPIIHTSAPHISHPAPVHTQPPVIRRPAPRPPITHPPIVRNPATHPPVRRPPIMTPPNPVTELPPVLTLPSTANNGNPPDIPGGIPPTAAPSDEPTKTFSPGTN